MTSEIPLLVFLVSCLIASVTDLRRRRVPNVLTYGTTAVIVALNATHGALWFFSSLGSSVAIILAGSVIFGFGWLGGGDIKLLAAGAAAVGFPNYLLTLLCIASAGGVLGAIYALRERRLAAMLSNVAMSALSGTNVTPAAQSRRVPYALAICAGSFLYAASESYAPWFRFVH